VCNEKAENLQPTPNFCWSCDLVNNNLFWERLSRQARTRRYIAQPGMFQRDKQIQQIIYKTSVGLTEQRAFVLSQAGQPSNHRYSSGPTGTLWGMFCRRVCFVCLMLTILLGVLASSRPLASITATVIDGSGAAVHKATGRWTLSSKRAIVFLLARQQWPGKRYGSKRVSRLNVPTGGNDARTLGNSRWRFVSSGPSLRTAIHHLCAQIKQ
jgi:hypothetical protein